MTQILGQEAFAVLLVKFTDSDDLLPFNLSQAQSAWDTIRRYWGYDSYGKVGLFGSQVFDWQTYPSTRAEFIAATKGPSAPRVQMIAAVNEAFGVDSTKFEHVIIIFDAAVGDAWTSGSGSIFDPTVMATGTICHEMTHQFGEPGHSYDFSNRQLVGAAVGEYLDQTDIMSAQNCWYAKQSAADPFSGSGPHHCMFWKDKFGWLDDTTLTRISDAELNSSYDHTFLLYSRNEPVAERLNCIQFLDIWVELDVNADRGDNVFYDDFDTGLRGAGVVIHQRRTDLSGNTVPYVLVPDLANNPDQKFWSAGQTCTRVESGPDPGVDVHVWVQSVDLVEGSAQVSISTGFPKPLTRHRVVAIQQSGSPSGTHRGSDQIGKVGILDGSGVTVPIDRAQVVAWIERRRNSFYVEGSDGSEAEVIVEGHGITMHPESNPADSLLSLPSL